MGRLFLIFITHMIFDREESPKRNWRNESKLTCKNWLHSMHWKLRFLKKIWMAKVSSKWQVRMDKLEICAVQDGVVDQIVANATDALKRCVIGQVFIIVLLNVEVGHLHRLEHVNLILLYI